LKKGNLSIGIILGLLIVLSLRPASAQEPLYGGSFTYSMGADPISFNGVLQFWISWSANAQRQTYDRLVDYDQDFNVIPGLAASWESTPDGRKHTFRLAKNVKFHDGKPLTSADVKYTYERILEYSSMRSGELRAAAFKSIETPDNYTVVFNFDKLFFFDDFAMYHGDNLILPKHIYDGKDFRDNPANRKPIGTGPFIVKEWVEKSHIIYEANQNYFKGRPYLDGLVIKIIPKPETALLALEKGEIDFAWRIPLADIERVKKTPNLDVIPTIGTGSWRINFNFNEEAKTKHPWLTSLPVRRAMEHAIDKESIIKSVLFGATIPQYSCVPSVLKFWNNPSIRMNKYDPVLAEKLLDEAGFKRGSDGVRFRLKMPIYHDVADEAEAVKAMWKKVGIEAEIVIVERMEFISRFENAKEGLRDYPLSLHHMGAGPDPRRITAWMHGNRTAPGTQNFGFYNNPNVNKLLDSGLSTIDRTLRKQYYDEVQKLVAEDQGWIFLWSSYGVTAASKKFKNYVSVDPSTAARAFDRVWWVEGKSPTTTVTSPRTTPTTAAPAVPSMDTTVGIVIVAAVILIGGAFILRRRKQ